MRVLASIRLMSKFWHSAPKLLRTKITLRVCLALCLCVCVLLSLFLCMSVCVLCVCAFTKWRKTQKGKISDSLYLLSCVSIFLSSKNKLLHRILFSQDKSTLTDRFLLDRPHQKRDKLMRAGFLAWAIVRKLRNSRIVPKTAVMNSANMAGDGGRISSLFAFSIFIKSEKTKTILCLL